MARELRIEFPGALYHITSRGNAGKTIYRSDEDREIFLRILGKVVTRYRFIIHAYCLMGNHYHLLIETPDANLSIGMQYLNGVYAQAFNSRNEHTGHLYQGRFKAILADREDYLLELARYIVLNPVKVGMAKEPSSYKWSSYLETIGKRKVPRFLDIEFILALFSEDKQTARRMFEEFVLEGLHHEISFAIRGKVLIGDDLYIDKIQNLIQQKREDKEIPINQRYMGRPCLDDCFKESIDRNVRNKRIYIAVLEFGYKQKEVADYLGLGYSTVSEIISAEERRLREN